MTTTIKILSGGERLERGAAKIKKTHEELGRRKKKQRRKGRSKQWFRGTTAKRFRKSDSDDFTPTGVLLGSRCSCERCGAALSSRRRSSADLTTTAPLNIPEDSTTSVAKPKFWLSHAGRFGARLQRCNPAPAQRTHRHSDCSQASFPLLSPVNTRATARHTIMLTVLSLSPHLPRLRSQAASPSFSGDASTTWRNPNLGATTRGLPVRPPPSSLAGIVAVKAPCVSTIGQA